MLMAGAGMRDHARDRQSLRARWTAIAGLCLLAFALRCLGADTRPFDYDSLYHVLAGRSWAAGHGVAIADGAYLRVQLYSVATGMGIALFGDTPFAARLPAMIAGAALAGLTYAWVRRVAGAQAGWIVGVLVCFGFRLIDLSQLARFYTWHVAAVWVFATQVYLLAVGWMGMRNGERAARSVLAFVALVAAAYVQATTAIALIAVGVWAVPMAAVTFGLNRWSRGLWLAIGGALALGLLVVVLEARLVVAGYEAFRGNALWADANSRRTTFYYSLLVDSYGWMLHLLPFAALLACRRWARPTLFCVVVIAVALLLHSLAGMKSDRYISYLDPFILSIWAMALAALVMPLVDLTVRPFKGLPVRVAMGLAGCVAAVCLSSAVLGVPMYRTTLAQIVNVGRGAPPYNGPDEADNEDVDWTPYLPVLRPLAQTSMLVTADDLRSLDYMGGYDLLLDRTVMWDFTQNEFGRDPRTGGHGITTVASLAAVMGCYPSGSILISLRRWRSADVPADVADFIERTAQPVPLPDALRMRAFTWRGPDRRAVPACQTIEASIGDHRQQIGERLVAMRP
jgi:hypothetical protein